MTDIMPGDYVRLTVEGEVERVVVTGRRPVVYFRTSDGNGHAATVDQLTVIDPPVRVGDEISYEQAKRLPFGSVALGVLNKKPYLVSSRERLLFGVDVITVTGQTFRVLHIPTEATS